MLVIYNKMPGAPAARARPELVDQSWTVSLRTYDILTVLANQHHESLSSVVRKIADVSLAEYAIAPDERKRYRRLVAEGRIRPRTAPRERTPDGVIGRTTQVSAETFDGISILALRNLKSVSAVLGEWLAQACEIEVERGRITEAAIRVAAKLREDGKKLEPTSGFEPETYGLRNSKTPKTSVALRTTHAPKTGGRS